MKQITVYELLGMIKDGKQPKHIKYRDEEWWWGYDTYTYFSDLERTPDAQTSLFDRYRMNYCLDDIVEIIEENNKIEKLNKSHFHKKQRQLANKINEIIDKINELNNEN